MEQVKEGVDVFKWFVELNAQGKAVIAILSIIICVSIYNNYQININLANERIRYDTLSDKYANNTKDCKTEQDSINMIWYNKYEDYRNRREKELKEITKLWEDRYNKLNLKITKYEKSN